MSGGAFQLTSTLDEDDVEQRTDCGLADGTVDKIRKLINYQSSSSRIDIETKNIFQAEVYKAINITDHLPWWPQKPVPREVPLRGG